MGLHVCFVCECVSIAMCVCLWLSIFRNACLTTYLSVFAQMPVCPPTYLCTVTWLSTWSVAYSSRRRWMYLRACHIDCTVCVCVGLSVPVAVCTDYSLFVCVYDHGCIEMCVDLPGSVAVCVQRLFIGVPRHQSAAASLGHSWPTRVVCRRRRWSGSHLHQHPTGS